jgi:hypothetical protein
MRFRRPKRVTQTPERNHRMGRIMAAMAQTMEQHPETRPGDRLIIIIDTEERGGLMSAGFDDDRDVVTSLLGHLQAAGEMAGVGISVMPMPRRGEG